MATIKSYTDISQSKTLSKILPLESADMNYWCGTQIRIGGHRTMDKDLDIPCWSLASLLSIIKKTTPYKMEYFGDKKVQLTCTLGDKPWELIISDFNNEVDACVDVIEKLHELNLL